MIEVCFPFYQVYHVILVRRIVLVNYTDNQFLCFYHFLHYYFLHTLLIFMCDTTGTFARADRKYGNWLFYYYKDMTEAELQSNTICVGCDGNKDNGNLGKTKKDSCYDPTVKNNNNSPAPGSSSTTISWKNCEKEDEKQTGSESSEERSAKCQAEHMDRPSAKASSSESCELMQNAFSCYPKCFCEDKENQEAIQNMFATYKQNYNCALQCDGKNLNTQNSESNINSTFLVIMGTFLGPGLCCVGVIIAVVCISQRRRGRTSAGQNVVQTRVVTSQQASHQSGVVLQMQPMQPSQMQRSQMGNNQVPIVPMVPVVQPMAYNNQQGGYPQAQSYPAVVQPMPMQGVPMVVPVQGGYGGPAGGAAGGVVVVQPMVVPVHNYNN